MIFEDVENNIIDFSTAVEYVKEIVKCAEKVSTINDLMYQVKGTIKLGVQTMKEAYAAYSRMICACGEMENDIVMDIIKTSISIQSNMLDGVDLFIIKQLERKLKAQQEYMLQFPPKYREEDRKEDMKEDMNQFMLLTSQSLKNIYLRIEIYEVLINRFNELKEKERKKDEDLIKMMEETKVTKDKRKQQEKQKAKEANQEHLRKKKEREEFYRKSGMLGAKPVKKTKKT